ncbi:MAG: putative DNA-binding domain-containing protein [Afipia sp.]|nr:putative DNA-binding domain-containing protein [Afipia sp.]
MTQIAELIRPQQRPAFVAAAPSRRRKPAARLADFRYGTPESLLNLMTARFPVVRRVVGDDSFFERARQFIALHPPRLPVLASYGGGFPQFIRTLSNEACFAYVADIAEIEMARVRAAYSAEAEALPRNAFANLRPEHVGTLRVRFHPSVSLVTSRFAIVSAWQTNQPGQSVPMGAWGRQSALIARADRKVDAWLLPAGGFAFLQALNDGSTIAAASRIAGRADNGFDLAANLDLLAGAGAVIGLK